MVKMVKQPDGSSICGQCCVAMATGRAIKNVIKVFGHSHATRTKELHKALSKLGVNSDNKLTRNYAKTPIPENCILKITYDSRKHSGHWVYLKKGICYDPSGEIYHWTNYTFNPSMGRITSFLIIK